MASCVFSLRGDLPDILFSGRANPPPGPILTENDAVAREFDGHRLCEGAIGPVRAKSAS